MARETKIGLLVGLCIILGFAWILSAHLSPEVHDDQVIQRRDEGPVGLAHVSTINDPIEREHQRRTVELAGSEAVDGEAERLADGSREPQRRSIDSLYRGEVGDVVLLDTSSDAYGRVERVSADDRSTRVGETASRDGERSPGGGGSEIGFDVSTLHRPAPQTPSIRQYTVKAGDSLYGIAESQYGRGRGELWKEIARENGITDPGRIRAGMTLKLPNIDPPAAAVASVGSGNAAVEAGGVAPASTVAGENRIDVAATGAGAGAAAGNKVHVVQAGDTLGAISMQYYGTSRKWKVIQEANPGLDPTSMRINQRLTIPAAPSTAVAAASSGERSGITGDVERSLREVSEAVAPALGTRRYIVKSGETLWGISTRELGSPSHIAEIRRLNSLSSDSIRPGQQLVLPSSASVAMVETGH